MQQNKWLLKADGDSDIWKAYVDYVDEIVIESLYEIIEYNLNYLLEESDPTLNKRVLFEVQLMLDVKTFVRCSNIHFDLFYSRIWIYGLIHRWNSVAPMVFMTSLIR